MSMTRYKASRPGGRWKMGFATEDAARAYADRYAARTGVIAAVEAYTVRSRRKHLPETAAGWDMRGMSHPELIMEQYIRLLCENLPENAIRYRTCVQNAAVTIAAIEEGRASIKRLEAQLREQMATVGQYVNAHWQPAEVAEAIRGVGREYKAADVVEDARRARRGGR